MKPNDKIREQIFLRIEKQIIDNEPPETKETFDRLCMQGFDEYRTMQLIGQCFAVELFNTLKNGEPYNNARYVNNLLALPKEPYEK